MRLGFIGDVHAEHERLATVIDFLKSRDADALYCVGDVVDGRGCANTCCDLLIRENVQAVRGNHDRWIFEGKDDLTPLSSLSAEATAFLQNLPKTLHVETPLGIILLCHGYGENDMARIGPDDRGYALEMAFDLHRLIDDKSLAMIVNGHSHKRMARKFNGLTVVNAGTLCDNHDPCFVELDCSEKHLQFYDLAADGNVLPAQNFRLSEIPDETIFY